MAMRRLAFDPWLLVPGLVLSAFGIGIQAFLRGGLQGPALLQLTFFGVGLTVFLLLSWARLIQIKTFTLPFYLTSLLLLGATLVVGTGFGVRRWIEFGPVRVQASEIAKPILAAFLAALGEDYEARRHPLVLALLLGFVSLIPFALVFKEPDLGTAFVYMAIWAGAVYAIRRVRLRHLAAGAVILGVLAVPAWDHLKPYQRERIITFLEPQADPLGRGYQPLQSQMAIGSGGLAGKGFTEESRRILAYLPGRQTDFVFAVVGRTTGLIGSVLTTLLFLALLFRLFQYAQVTDDVFVRFCAMGQAAYIGFQALINIGVALGLAPVTGIPLPFISQGGSGMVAAWTALGCMNACFPAFLFSAHQRAKEARIV